jgi:hypothetical protein
MSEEQHAYAKWLDVGTRVALTLLIASFLLYAFGIVDPLLPPSELPKLWTLPVDRFVAASGAPTGWGWLQLLHRSDYLIFVSVAMLCLITVACYARLVPILLKEGERWRAAIAIAQIAVLLGAALL